MRFELVKKASFSVTALTTLFLSVAPAAHAEPAPSTELGIISDFDDTIRMTGVKHLFHELKVVFTNDKRVFAGMSELYRQILSAPSSDSEQDFFIVSGGPALLDPEVRNVLEKNGFPTAHVNDRLFAPLPPIQGFKQKKFAQILESRPHERFVFFGDDTERDPDALAFAGKRYPGQVAALYIHKVEGARALQPGEIPYYSAMDVALHEMQDQRMKADGAIAVARAILESRDFPKGVIAPYSKLCPPKNWLTTLASSLNLDPTEPLSRNLEEIENGVNSLPRCSAR